MMARYDFKQDLVDGQKFEDIVLERLNHKRLSDLFIKNTDPAKLKYYDLINSQTKVEIKLDKDSEKYNNVFFEVFNSRGWKTGLLATWADYVIYGVVVPPDIKIYNFPYKDLMTFLFSYPCEIKQKSGDCGGTVGLVVPLEVMTNRPFATKIGTVRRWW